MLLKHFFHNNSVRSIITLLLIIVLVLSVGCSKNEVTSVDETPVSSTDTGAVDNSTNSDVSDVESEDTVSEEYNLDGNYTVTDSIIIDRDDAKESIYTGNCANLSNPLKGYADDEADKLRNEILNADNTEKNYKITGTKYYVSPNGNDGNDGTSENTPLRTLQGVSGIYLKEGDAVLFERGSVFRTANTISAKSGVIYGSYGEGDKPKIYAAPISLADSKIWEPTKTKNVWKVSYPYKEVGSIVFNHGEIIGYKKNKTKEIAKDYDFYHDSDNGVLYLRFSKGNPAKHFKSIEASTSIYLFTIPTKAHDIVIDNICLKYSAYMGIHATRAENITITNCEIGYIGGKNYNAQDRFGNAIEAWSGAINFNISNNWIYQTFDSAITWQGSSGGAYENIKVTNNLMEYNNGDIEFWDSEQHTLKNVVMDNNIMRFNAMGWGTRVDDGGIRGIEGPIVGTSVYVTGSDISVCNNIIDCPSRVIIKWDFNPEFKSAIKTSGNKIYVKNSYRTTDLVFKNPHMTNYNANDLTQLKAAFAEFDPSAELFWYE